MKLYQKLATLVQARLNCLASGNDEWFSKHEAEIKRLVKEYLPSGSGFDLGTRIDLDKSDAEKLVFETSYHHMNEHGSYDGWTSHQVIVTPSLAFGFGLALKGRDRNDIKDYMADVFDYSLRTDVVEKKEAA